MRFNSDSSRFPNTILIWEDQLNEIMNTTDQVIHHSVQENYVKSFTTLSLVQALHNKQFKTRNSDAEGKTFFIVSYNNLVEVP